MNPIKNLLSFKTVYSENKTYLVFSIGKKEEINYSQVQMLENDACHEYLLPFQCTKTAKSNKISFNVSGLTSLSEYLKTEMSQEEYFEIIAGIQRIISFCQRSYLSYDNLICDPKYMYYHNTLKRILMMYIPLKNPHYICDSIPKCLVNIHKNAKRVIITDGNYLTRYERYLTQYASSDKKKGNSFSPDSLLHFFNENAASENSVIPSRPQPDKNARREPNYSINNQIAPSEQRRQPLNTSATIGAAIDDTAFENPANPSYSATVVRSRRDEIFLTDDFGSRYDINNFPFNIGRSPANDLVIEQPTVSGKHAVITENEGHFFIKDLSTNGTYIHDEDNKISNAEIFDGDRIIFDRYGYTFSCIRTAPEDVTTKTVMVSRRRHSEKPADSTAPAAENTAPAVSEGKALAYLKRMSDESRIKIINFPFESDEADGVAIFVQNTGGTPDIFIKNVSCGALSFEGTAIEQGMTAELFSGCSLEINGEAFMFIIEN